MAAEADNVVVELVANTGKFTSDVNAAASSFQQSMSVIERSAGRAEQTFHKVGKSSDEIVTAFARQERQARLLAQVLDETGKSHARLSLAANNNRIAMLEMQHVVRGSVDQFAAGAPLTQIFAQHVASVGEAAALSGSSMGKFGAFLSGPWGLAITAGIAVLATFIGKHKEEGDSVESLIDKLKDHAQKTANSEEADRIWSQTLDGLIEKQKELKKTLDDRLSVQSAVDVQQLGQLEKERDDLTKRLDAADREVRRLQKLYDAAPKGPTAGGVGIGQGAQIGTGESANLLSQLTAAQTNLRTLRIALGDVTANAERMRVIVGQAEGAAFADLSASAKRFADLQTDSLATTFQALKLGKPDIATASAAFDTLASAMTDAAGAGVHFEDAQVKEAGFAADLLHHKITVTDYAKAVRDLAAALAAQTEAAKEANKNKVDPVAQFKQSVIGAEGTGPNKLGSSAAGFGQFMPKTWLSYFDRLFPDKADLDNSAKLAYRNVRSVAEAVIDKATDDYKAVLTKAGQNITAANLYTVHLLGAGDAKKLLTAAPSTQTSAVLSPAVLKGNPFLQGTVAQAEAAIAKRIGDSSSAVSAAVVAMAAAAKQELERERQFQQERDALEGQILDARKALGLSAEENAALEKAAAKLAHDRYEADVKQLAAEGKLRGDIGALLAKNDALEKARNAVTEARLQQERFAEQQEANRRADAVTSASYAAQEQLLQSQDGLARTASERRAIEQRLLDLQYAQEKTELESVIANAARLRVEADTLKSKEAIKAAADAEAQAAIARTRLGTLDQRYANAAIGNNRQNASPLQSYFNSIPRGAAELNEALEQVAANGLQNVVDGLAEAVVQFHSLKDVGAAALRGLESELIKLALRLVIAHTLGKLFGDSFRSSGDTAAKAAEDAAAKVAAVAAEQLALQAIQASAGAASTAAAVAQAAAVGAAWAPAAAAAALATLGGNAGPAAAALVATNALSTALAVPRAMGGPIFGPGGPTDDRVLVAASNGEYVIRAASAQRLGPDALDYMNTHGEFPALGNGRAIQPMNVAASAPGSRAGFSSGDIRELRSIVRDAVHAVPDIKLVNAIDSGSLYSHGLNTKVGEKAFFNFVTANATSIKSMLNRP